MNIAYWLSQLIAVIAYILLGIGLWKKERIKILIFSSIYQALLIVHYSLLLGIMGIISGVITLLRNFLFIYNEKKDQNNQPWILILFSVLSLVLTVIFYKNPVDIFPCILTLLGIFVYWIRNTKVTRIGNLIISVCYIIYAISLHSWFSIICELYVIGCTLSGYYKYEIKHKT